MTSPEPLYYFAYGSNLSLEQMKARCPSSPFYSFGILEDYKWIINKRGYANVVDMRAKPVLNSFTQLLFGTTAAERRELADPASEDSTATQTHYIVQGLLFTLASPTDEEALDRAEGVPLDYQKHLCIIQIPTPTGFRTVTALVYVDAENVEPGIPKKEYVGRINRGIQDAVERGMDQDYVDKYIRKFVLEID